MRRLAKIALILTLSLLSACGPATRTQGVSFADPDYAGARFASLVVEADKANLQERTAIERSATAQLRKVGIDAVASVDLVPPTRAYNAAKLRSVLRSSGKQGLLTIADGSKRIVRDYIPPAPSYYRRDGRRFYHNGGMWQDDYMGPQILDEPEVDYNVTLYVLPGMAKAWTGAFTVRGPDGMSFESVGVSFAQQLVERLTVDNMIAAIPPQ